MGDEMIIVDGRDGNSSRGLHSNIALLTFPLNSPEIQLIVYSFSDSFVSPIINKSTMT